MAQNNWKKLSWDKTDLPFNETLGPFYDSTDKISFANFLTLKKTLSDMTLDTTFGDDVGLKNIGQQYFKQNDLNIFAEDSYNEYLGNAIEKRLFDDKNIVLHGSDIYNKYTNYFDDLTSNLIIKIDLTSLISQFESDSDMSIYLQKSANSYAKYYFNVKSIIPISRKNVSYSTILNLYQQKTFQPYFYKVNTVIKSVMALRRHLYDYWYTQKRKSFLLFDFTSTSYWGVHFYDVRYDNTNKLIFKFEKHEFVFAQRHVKYNQVNGITYDYLASSSSLATDNDQRSNTLDVHNVFPPSDSSHSNVNVIRSSPQTTPYNTWVRRKYDFTHDISSFTEFSSSDIKYAEINESKQHSQVDSTMQSSLYTLRITTIEGKQFSVPFIVDLTSLPSYVQEISVRNVIDKTKCTLFDQNELNSRFDTDQTVEQDIFDITDILSLQSYDDTLDILTINKDSIKVTNDTLSFNINSDTTKILKHGNYFLNKYVLIDRNLHGLDDPQNWSCLNIMEDYPEKNIQDRAIITPFGKSDVSVTAGIAGTTRYLYSSIQNSTICGPDTASYQISHQGSDIRYELYNTSTGVLRVYNQAKNLHANSVTIDQSRNYKSNTQYAQGIHGIYNSLLNVIYFVERSFSTPNYPHWLTKWNLQTDTKTNLKSSNCNGGNTDTSTCKWSKFVIDSTSLEMHFIGESSSLKYFYRNKYNFSKGNFNTYMQYYYGVFWEQKYDSRILHGYPTFVNDNTMMLSDSLGNIYKIKYDLTSASSTQYSVTDHNKSKIDIDTYKRLYLPAKSSMNWSVKTDQTTTQGQSYANLGYQQGVFYKITPDSVKIFPVVPIQSGGQLLFEYYQFNQVTFFLDNSTQISSQFYATEDGQAHRQQPLFRFTIDLDDGTTNGTTLYSTTPGKLTLVDIDNRLLYGMEDHYAGTYTESREIYTYNIDTLAVTKIADKFPRIAHIYLQTKDLDTDYYYFLGTNSDDTSKIIFIRCDQDADLTSWSVLNEQNIPNFPYYTSTTNSKNSFFEGYGGLYVKDTSFHGIMIPEDSPNLWKSFILMPKDDESSVWCFYRSTLNIKDETVDLDYERMKSTGSIYSLYIDNQFTFGCLGAPFKIDRFDHDTTQVVHAKLQDDPFTQYIDSGTNVTYDDATSASAQRFMGYTLATENKHYSVYPSNKVWCYVKVKDGIYPPYTPRMNHRIIAVGDQTLETNLDAYTNGWLVDSDVWFNCRDYPTTYAVGDTSYAYRYIEQRKLDTLFNFQKIYRPTWKDSYSSGSYGTIPTSQRDDDNTDIIYLCSNSGCIYSQNQYSNELDKVNVWKGIAGSGFKTRYFGNPTKRFVVTDTSKWYSAAGSSASKCTFIYNKTRNRWYYGAFAGPTKLNILTTRMLFGFYCGGDYLIQPYQYSDAAYTGFTYGLTTDIQQQLGYKSGINFFCPTPPDVNRQYWDDQSNMIQTQDIDQYIITKPKFYNNIFSTDICPETFDEYSDSLHTTIDEKWWAGSVGMAQWRNIYDNIYVYKLTMSATDHYVVKNFKINGELSFNYRLLQYQRHNVCVANYTWDNLLNRALTTMNANLLSDFTATDFTKVDSSTLFVDGLIKFDQTISAYQEWVDVYGAYNNVATSPGYTTQYTTTDNTLTRKTIYSPVTCECLDSTISATVNFDDITSITVSEFNDFYITLSVTDGTSNTTTVNLSNPKNTFIEFNNNKAYWVARTAFFKRDVPDRTMAGYPYSDLYSVFNFTIVPPAGRICRSEQRFRKDSTSSSNRYYQRYYERDSSIYNYDTTVDLYYSVPLFYAHDTSIMWFANDVSNRLFSLNLGTGEIVSDYTDTKVRYKKPDGTTFKIWYEEIIGDDFLRYIGSLGIDGTLSEITKKDVLTNYILSNKNTDTTNFTVTSHENLIEITNGTDISISGINLGTRKQFESINWYVDSSDVAYISINVRNFNSHTSDEHILIANKTNQNWEIENKIFGDFVYDGSNQVSVQDVMFGIFKKSNGIVSMKESVNYPLMTNLISFYDSDAGAIKYFDFTNGLIYKLEDVVVYNGAFLQRGQSSSYSLNKKEFAICDKMYPNMLYCDDLPDIFFYPYKCKYDVTKTFGSPINYVYDETSLYLLTNFSSLVDKVKIEMDSLILVNYNKELVDYIFELTSDDLITVTNVIDFTGAFPYGLIALRKINKYLEYSRINRFARVKFDITFPDQSNQFPDADFIYSSTGVDSSYYNPFIGSTIAVQNFTTLTAMQSVGSSMYADFTGSGQPSNLFPNQSYRGSLSLNNHTLLDRTGSTFEITIPPQATTENYMCIYMNPFDKQLHQTLTTSNLYFSHFKLYWSKAIVKVSLTYNPKVYEIIDSGMKGKTINLSDYTYAYYDTIMKPYDYKKFLQKSHTNRLNAWLQGITNDGSLLYKTINQCYGVVLGTDLTSLNTNFIDDNSTTIQAYTGNTDRTNQITGLTFDENTDYTPLYGTFTFSSDIGTYNVYFLITDLHCGVTDLIDIDVTIQLYDASDVLVKTSIVSSPNPNGVNTSLHKVDLGNYYTFRKLKITAIKTAGEFPIKIWGLMIKNTNLTFMIPPLFIGQVEGVTGFNCQLNTGYPHNLNDSIVLAQGGWNNGTDQTITIFVPEGDIVGRNQDDFTLYMNGYDGTFILLEEGTNSWQQQDFTFTDNKIVGFKINVKPEAFHSTPIIKINTDVTSDDFANNDGETLFDAGYIKGIK